MKDTGLLLDDDERTVAWNEGVESGRMDWIWAGAEAVARAQVAKVLAVLGRYAMIDSKVTGLSHPACNTISAEEIQRIAQETGLTWPPKEG